jgi:polyphosphate kinase
MEGEHSPHAMDGIVRVPPQLGRFLRLPGSDVKFIAIEDVVRLHLPWLFPNFKVIGSGIFRLVRDSDLDVEDLDVEEDAEHLLLSFETALQRRRHGQVVRLSTSADMHPDLSEFLIEQLDVPREATHAFQGLIGLSGVADLISDAPPDLLFKPFSPRFPERVRDYGGDCFAAIKAKDILVHHPYESFDVVVQFIRQATADPAVVAIKQTLYRTSENSPIVQALIEAAQAGKSVTAVVELKARFDEEANLRWARDLERAGAQVTYGFLELKIHAKLSLVVRREATGLVSYIHYGTGNYHPLTARVYTDLSLFSCDPALCGDAARLFTYMTGYAEPEALEKIAASPIGLRQRLIALIENETKHARQGQPAAIWFKLNGLTDPEMIDRLYDASAAGVEIHGIVRGMCALRAGVPGLSENIHIRSIVGRFLEHARIVCFGNGAELPSAQAKIFISSADWMPRNLDHRIETLVPIENETVRQQVMDQIMVANLKDDTQAWELSPSGDWVKVHAKRHPFSAQDYFMSNPSLSGRGSAPSDSRFPPRLRLRRR